MNNFVKNQMDFLYESVKKTFRPVNYEEEKDKMIEADIERAMLYPEDDEDKFNDR